MHSTPVLLKPVIALAAAGIIATSLAGCSVVTSIVHQDAWAVSYEIAVDGSDPVELSHVRYETQPKRGEDRETIDVGSVTTASLGTDGSTGWRTDDALLEVKTKAELTATVPKGTSATCRILLDKTRVIAEEKASKDGSLRCEVVTPEFEK